MTGSRIAYNIIWQLPFFSGLKDEEKAELLKVVSFRKAQRKEMLFLQGDPITQLYWVCSGAIQIFRETPDGHETTVALRIPGDAIFGPDAAGRLFNHTMNARAVKETVLASIPSSWMREHLHSFDGLAENFVILMAQRVQETQIEIEHQATMNASQIIACFLQHLCVLHHFDPRGFDLPYTKSLIASRMGMTLENFSRTLPHLKESGITVQGKHVSFDDVGAAQCASCDFCSVIGECRVHKTMKAMAEEKQPVRREGLAG